MTERKVRILGTNLYATFTQRGNYPANGFVRLRTAPYRDTLIVGENYDGIFYPQGKNRNVPAQFEAEQQGFGSL